MMLLLAFFVLMMTPAATTLAAAASPSYIVWNKLHAAHLSLNLVEGFAYGVPFHDANYISTVKRALHVPAGGRYPGGTFAMFFNITRADWVDGCATTLRKGLGMRVRGCGDSGSGKRDFYGVAMHPAGTFSARNYVRHLGLPTFVLNVLTSDDVARDIEVCLDAANTNNDDDDDVVVSFEVGNEMYYQPPYDGNAYLRVAQTTLEQLRRAAQMRSNVRVAAGIPLDVNGSPFVVRQYPGAMQGGDAYNKATSWNRALLPVVVKGNFTTAATAAVIHTNCAALMVTRALARDPGIRHASRWHAWMTYIVAEPEAMLDSFADTAEKIGMTLWLTEFDSGSCVLDEWSVDKEASNFVKRASFGKAGGLRYISTLLVCTSTSTKAL